MNPSSPLVPASDLSALWVGSSNLLNLALPGRQFYPNQDPYSARDYERKLTWLGEMLRRLNTDIQGFQEVWDEQALQAAVARSGLSRMKAVAPGAEHGAQGTPCVGLATRLAIEAVHSHADFAPSEAVEVPEQGLKTRFERPVLQATLRHARGQRLHVLVAHLKSKRPRFLQDAAGQPLEDRDDPRVQCRAALRSLITRGAEAAALRRLVIDLIHRSQEPLILLGDMNDGPFSVTSQLIAAQDAVAYDRKARDAALFHAVDVQSEPGLRRDMLYSHVHQGWPELLDQIWVSEEWVAGSRGAIGDVRRVEVFNDHLHEGRDRSRSDHGFVRALLRIKPVTPSPETGHSEPQSPGN